MRQGNGVWGKLVLVNGCRDKEIRKLWYSMHKKRGKEQSTCIEAESFSKGLVELSKRTVNIDFPNRQTEITTNQPYPNNHMRRKREKRRNRGKERVKAQ